MKVKDDLISAQLDCSSSVLAWPAWWTLEAGTRSLLALAMDLDPEGIERPLCLGMVLNTVARRWTRRAVFGNFVAAMFTPEGDGAWWSSTHYLIMAEKATPITKTPNKHHLPLLS
jgi:hypothetical protein